MASRRLFGLDAYSPEEIAERVETQGVARAHLPLMPKFMLGVIGGGFIGLGAMLHVIITADPDLNPGAARLLGSVGFAMGYVLALTGGAAVFTTNVLMIMTWAAGKISGLTLLRSWTLVLLANVVGAVGLVVLLAYSDLPAMYDHAVAANALHIGAAKSHESLSVAFVHGVLGNLLICIAVWVAMAGRSVTDKMLAPLLPIACVPLAGFEHSVGNLFYLPLAAMIHLTEPEVVAQAGIGFSGWGASRNLVAVIAGNIIGGSALVGLAYHMIYRRAVSGLQRQSPHRA